MGDLAQKDDFAGMFDDLDILEGNLNNKPNLSVVSNNQPIQAPGSVPGIGNKDALVVSGLAKITNIRKEMNDLFFERSEVIENALRALIIGQSMLLLGPPGTAKSLFTNELCKRIEQANFFGWLLNRTSDPAEILGPYSIKAMEKDKFLRKTEGKLPEAHIAFLDEIFKCNEPTLNILLPLINEKVFFNDGKAVDVPLVSLFASSNEVPEEDSLDALYDRLIFRMWIDYVQDAGNKKKMYEGYLKKRAGASVNSYTTITLDELTALKEHAAKMPVDDSIIKAFIKLMLLLTKQGIKVSDRRQNECFKVMQGSAVLNGRNCVSLDDLNSLTYVLWSKKEDIEFIQTEVTKLINPYDEKYNDLVKKFNEIKTGLDKITDESEKCRSALEARSGLESILGKFDNLIKESRKSGKDVTAMEEQRSIVITFNEALMQEALGMNLAFDSNEDPF